MCHSHKIEAYLWQMGKRPSGPSRQPRSARVSWQAAATSASPAGSASAWRSDRSTDLWRCSKKRKHFKFELPAIKTSVSWFLNQLWHYGTLKNPWIALITVPGGEERWGRVEGVLVAEGWGVHGRGGGRPGGGRCIGRRRRRVLHVNEFNRICTNFC